MNLHYLWQDVFLLFLNFIFGVSFLPLLVFLLHNKFSFEAIHPFWKLSYSSGVLLMFYWFLSGPGVKCLHRYFLATPTVSSENVLNNLHGIQWLTALFSEKLLLYLLIKFILVYLLLFNPTRKRYRIFPNMTSHEQLKSKQNVLLISIFMSFPALCLFYSVEKRRENVGPQQSLY